MLIDSHCHLTSQRFAADLPAVIERMRLAGLGGCVTIGTGIADAERALALAAAHPGIIHASTGLDPFSAHEAGAAFPEHLARLRALLAGGGFRALGECGIEHHHDLDSAPVQRERFAAQIALAIELDLPLVVHARSGPRGGDAHAVALDLIRAHPRSRGVIHSFDGDPEQARAWLDAGFHIAVNGMVTFKGNDRLRDAVRGIPADRLLIETDAPFLAPVPWRGRRNEPALVVQTAAVLAEVRGEPLAEVAQATAANTRRLFRL